MKIRTLLFVAGALACMIGFHASAASSNPEAAVALLQGALTLGGGWIICGLFTFHSHWHGVAGGGILALLAAARCAPSLLEIPNFQNFGTTQQLAALALSLVVLITTVRAMMAERARKQLENLSNEE